MLTINENLIVIEIESSSPFEEAEMFRNSILDLISGFDFKSAGEFAAREAISAGVQLVKLIPIDQGRKFKKSIVIQINTVNPIEDAERFRNALLDLISGYELNSYNENRSRDAINGAIQLVRAMSISEGITINHTKPTTNRR